MQKKKRKQINHGNDGINEFDLQNYGHSTTKNVFAKQVQVCGGSLHSTVYSPCILTVHYLWHLRCSYRAGLLGNTASFTSHHPPNHLEGWSPARYELRPWSLVLSARPKTSFLFRGSCSFSSVLATCDSITCDSITIPVTAPSAYSSGWCSSG